VPWFQFFIRGENYRIKFGDEITMCGFFTTRNFKTNTLEQAQNLAYESIREDNFLNAHLHEGMEPIPTIFLEEIYELDRKPKKVGRWPFGTRKGKGFTFFTYNDDENESLENE